MSNCSDQFPTTDILYAELRSSNNVTVPILAGMCCLLAVIVIGIFIESAWFVVHHYPHKTQRNKFICLLGLYPVVSCTSVLAVLVPTATFLCELVAATHLSICIVVFVNVVMSYYGGKNGLLAKMSDEKMGFATPPLCCCCLCLNNKPFNRKYLQIATIMTFQTTIVKPIALFIAAVLWSNGMYVAGDQNSPTHAVFYTNWLSVASTLVGIWGLAVTYRSTRAKLEEYRIGIKFACLQFVLIFMNVQFAIIGLLARNDIPACEGTRDSRVRGYRIHHSLLILEMFLLSMLARFAYRRYDPALLHQVAELKDISQTANGDV